MKSTTKRAKSANSTRSTNTYSTPLPQAPLSHREEYFGSNSSSANSSYNGPTGKSHAQHNRSSSIGPPGRERTGTSMNASFSSNGNNEMLDVKINRKRAESDLQLLANRFPFKKYALIFSKAHVLFSESLF